jgi:molybdate transport system ATP-binding protein
MLKIENFSISAQDSIVFSLDKFLAENANKVNIVGSNRTGKTIFFRAIHGEYFDFSGDIYIKEKPPVFYKKRRKTISVESISHLLPEDSIWKNITLPIVKVTQGQKEKIPELCQIAELGEIYGRRVKHLSYSSQKFVELIRAVIQLPYIILIDDADSFFDDINLLKMHRICNFAVENGTTLLVSSKRKLENFDSYFRIQSKELVQI